MQDLTNYDRIATAIEYMKTHFKEQPDLNEIAEKVHLSPFHFQRMFSEWAGVSPKKFLQYLSIGYAKSLLQDKGATLFNTAFETGLSGTGRLHDLFIGIEGMTPGEYKNGGEDLFINYSFAESPFGEIIVAATPKGICHLAFVGQASVAASEKVSPVSSEEKPSPVSSEKAAAALPGATDLSDEQAAFTELQARFPNASYRQTVDLIQQNALYIFSQDWSRLSDIRLHLKGTPFQIKVWEALLNIPMGGLSTYSTISGKIGSPAASRAVGSAVGSNPVAFLIPCHRVIRSSGETGEYHWGSTRKTAMIGWEAAKTDIPAPDPR